MKIRNFWNLEMGGLAGIGSGIFLFFLVDDETLNDNRNLTSLT